MADPRVDKLAQLLVNYCIGVQPNQWVVVTGDPVTIPLMEAINHYVIKAGGHLTPLVSVAGIQETFLKEASDEQLTWVSPLSEVMVEKVEGFISLRGSSNTRHLSGVDPQRQQLSQRGQKRISDVMRRRMGDGSLPWVITQFPCDALAQEAEMSLREYEDFVYGATFADQPDPVQKWQEMHDMQQRIVDWLAGKKTIEVRGVNADLTLSIEGRSFINSDGKKNMPSGEVFTSPIEDSVNGWVNFSYPAVRGGREVEGVRLVFENGRVVQASATKGEEYLLSQLDLDEGARIIGEWAIGTNYGIQRFTKSILFDEKIGGSMHLAVGSGFPEAGGKNESLLHWDFITDMRTDSEIRVDGDLLYQNGAFQI